MLMELFTVFIAPLLILGGIVLGVLGMCWVLSKLMNDKEETRKRNRIYDIDYSKKY